MPRAVALRCGDMNRSSHQGKAAACKGKTRKRKRSIAYALPCPRVRHGSQARERSTKKPGSCTRTAEATRANDSDAHARRRHRHAPSGSAVHGSCLASTVRPVQRRTRMAAWQTGRADGRPGSMGVSPLSLLAFSWRARVAVVQCAICLPAPAVTVAAVPRTVTHKNSSRTRTN